MLRGLGLLFGFILFSAKGLAEADIDPRLGPPFSMRSRPWLGESDAPIVVIEIGSFTCGNCELFQENLFPKLKSRYIDTGMVQWTMLMTLQSPPQSGPTPAATTPRYEIKVDPSNYATRILAVAHCALNQGRYWDVEKFLFQNSILPENEFNALLAKNRSMDVAVLSQCLVAKSPIYNEIWADMIEPIQAQIKHIPTFIVRRRRPDGKYLEARIEGYQPMEYFDRIFSAMIGKQ